MTIHDLTRASVLLEILVIACLLDGAVQWLAFGLMAGIDCHGRARPVVIGRGPATAGRMIRHGVVRGRPFFRTGVRFPEPVPGCQRRIRRTAVVPTPGSLLKVSSAPMDEARRRLSASPVPVPAAPASCKPT
jgi:hypothetical protein